MTSFERLALVNLDTAQAIVDDHESFELYAAELLIRNAAVLTGRLQADHFFDLPESAEQIALQAAGAANALAPLNPEEMQPLASEDSLEFHYRVAVQLPLKKLQRKVSTSNYTKDGTDALPQYKAAIQLGSMAFSAILLASEYNPMIRSSERYFWSNTNAAAGRIAQLRRDQ